MHTTRPLRRHLLLALSLLSGCAAGTSAGGDGASVAASSRFGAYLIGRVAQDDHDLALASRNLLAALPPDGGDPVVLNQAFMAAMLDGRPEALTLARRLPGNPIARLLLGNQAARAGNWAAAQAQFASLDQSDGNAGLTHLMAPLLIAWSQAGQADVDGAIATLQPLIRQGQQLGVLFALHAALIADLGNRYPQAARLYGLATGGTGGLNLRMARIEANWQYRQGHVDDAAATLQALSSTSATLGLVVPGLQADVKTRPIRTPLDGLAEVYLSFAAELHDARGNDTALALLRMALDLRPDLTAARMLMADTLDAAHHTGMALHVLAPVGNGDPLAPLVRLRRAQLQAAAGDTAAATESLRQLAAALPDQPEPLAALSDLQRSHGDVPGAIASLTQALGRMPAGSPSIWPLLFARAVCEQQVGQWPRAEADLRAALVLAPDQPELLNFLGYAWADRNEHLPEARTMLARAALLRPTDGAIIDSLGWVMLRQGDVAGAVTSLEHAVQLQSQDAEVNGHLGDAYWAAGHKLQARYQWQRALSLKPDPATRPKLEAKLQDAVRATDAAH